ncbi:MAG: hypothetical protein NVSMB1_02200 [Polyangiales bacterium]
MVDDAPSPAGKSPKTPSPSQSVTRIGFAGASGSNSSNSSNSSSGPSQPNDPKPSERPRLPALSPLETVGILAFALTHFLLGSGPIWQHPFRADQSILYSYIPLPLLVGLVLVVRRKWSLLGWVFDTFRVVVFKFVITGFILVALWSAVSPMMTSTVRSGTSRSINAVDTPFFVPNERAEEAPTSASPFNELALGSIDGRAPPFAVVYIAAGLEPYRFASAAREPVAFLDHDGRSFLPFATVLQVGRALVARSHDARLHTLLATDEGGRQLFSTPIVARTSSRPVIFTEAVGTVFVHCGVHRDEGRSRIVVIAHPFVTTASASGGFRFEGLPAGRLQVAWFAAKSALGSEGPPSMMVDVIAKQVAHVELAPK